MFDELLSSLPRPVAGRPISRPLVPQSLAQPLTRCGRLGASCSAIDAANARVLFGMATPLGTEPETVRGVWVRQVCGPRTQVNDTERGCCRFESNPAPLGIRDLDIVLSNVVL